jgi:hypothetical protein
MYAESSILEYGEAIYEASKTFRGVHRKQRGHPVKDVARIVDILRGENGAAERGSRRTLGLNSMLFLLSGRSVRRR